MTNDRLPINRINRSEETDSSSGNPTAQERFSPEEMENILRDFSVRFKQAFRGLRNRDIARKLLTTDKTVMYYADGARLPIVEMLLQIHKVTGVSLDWLILGKNQINTDFSGYFSEQELVEIADSAAENGRTFAEEVRALALAHLEAKKKYQS